MSRTTITEDERDHLIQLFDGARAANATATLLTRLAEDLLEDWDMNSMTFDAINDGDATVDATVDALLATLGVTVVNVPPASTREEPNK